MNVFLILIITIVIEFLIFSLILRRDYFKLFCYSLIINAFTNPLANFAFSFNISLLLIELCVLAVELFLIKYLFEINYEKAMELSAIANLLSFIVGFALL